MPVSPCGQALLGESPGRFPPIAMLGAVLIVVAVIVSELKTKGQKAVELAEALEQERQG